jgi:hypothetical protein
MRLFEGAVPAYSKKSCPKGEGRFRAFALVAAEHAALSLTS